MPTYLNVLNNAILRANLPPSKGNPAAYGNYMRCYQDRDISADIDMSSYLNALSYLTVVM